MCLEMKQLKIGDNFKIRTIKIRQGRFYVFFFLTAKNKYSMLILGDKNAKKCKRKK